MNRARGWRWLSVVLVYLAIGAAITLSLVVLPALLGPPLGGGRSKPYWPVNLPSGWPKYPFSPQPAAGIQAEGASGMTYAAAALGREWRRTLVYVIQNGERSIYIAEMLRTGWPCKAAVVQVLEVLTYTTKPSTRITLPDSEPSVHRGIALGDPSGASDRIGPTIPLKFLPGPLLINTLFWSLICAAPAAILHAFETKSRRMLWRRRRGLCKHCGYPRSDSKTCSECDRHPGVPIE